MISSISEMKSKFDNSELINSMSNVNILSPGRKDFKENINNNLKKVG